MHQGVVFEDIAVLIDVHRYRYISGSQIAKLHFPSMQTMWRRIRTLLDLGLVKSFTVHSIPERIFHLDKKGAEIVSVELTVDIAWHRQTKHPRDYYFLRHFLAINDFRILLTLACQKSSLVLLGFIPESQGEQMGNGYVKRFLRDNVKHYGHTPDGVFALEKDGNPALFFLEIDRGGEVVSDPEKGLLKAVIFYLNYWVEKKWQRYSKDFEREFKTFRTLIITTSTQRVQHLREATTSYPFHDDLAKRFLWATTEDQATEDAIFAGIWQSLDITDERLYKIG